MGRRVVPFVIGNMFKQVLDEEDLSIGRKNELLDMLYEKDIVSDPEFRMYLSMTYDRVRELTEDEVNKKVDNVNDAKTANANAASKESETDIDAMITKWISVCRTIITAKWTASEQIAKDYMALIRAHVRSYVGTKEDKADNKAASQGTNYQKDQQKKEEAPKEGENEEQK